MTSIFDKVFGYRFWKFVMTTKAAQQNGHIIN